MQGGNEMKASKMFKSIASSVLVMAMVVPMLASAPASTTQAAKKMSLSAKSTLLTVGSTKSVSVKNFAKGSKFTWKSSTKSVATVSGKKKTATVTAKAAGKAKISCIVKKGKKKTTVSGFTVKVRQKISSFTMQDASKKSALTANIRPNEKMVLVGAINNNAKGSTSNQTVTWTSSNSKIVSVKKKNINSVTITGLSDGTATITATVAGKASDKKSVVCTVKVSGPALPTEAPKKEPTKAPTATPKTNIKATATPWKYPKESTIYDQHYNVTRWYDAGTANGHKHDGYKNNTFAIWMVGFFDNQYSTNDEGFNDTAGPELDDYKTKELHVKGTFSYEGTTQKTILFQINYTSPSDYPILWKWENNASKAGKTPDQTELNVKSNKSSAYGDEAAAPNKEYDLDLNFTIPSTAKNGDKDDATGKNFGIYLYFPNKPGGALAFVKDNTFHFKNFLIEKK